MERSPSTNFLGLGTPMELRRTIEEHRGSCTADAAIYMPTSGIHRPVPSKLPIHQQQQFMSFKSVHEGLHSNKRPQGVVDVRMSGFHSVMPMGVSDANNIHRTSAMMAQKNLVRGMQGNKSFTSFLNLTNKYSFPLPSHPSRGTPNPGSPQFMNNSHAQHYPYGLPVVNGHGFVGSPQSPFPGQYPASALQQQHRGAGAASFEAPVTCPANDGYNPINNSQLLPTSGQLTIFFGGMVNVYENVSLEKIQAIMSMASNRSDISPENSIAAKQAPLVHPSKVRPADLPARVLKPIDLPARVRPADSPARVRPADAVMIRHPPQTNVVPHYSGLCSPTSAATLSVDHSASSSNIPYERNVSNSPTPAENKVSPEDESETKTTPMSKAVPMARKASLARFLEKRKERMSHLSPYHSLAQKQSDGSSTGIKAIGTFIDNQPSKSMKSTSGAKGLPWHPARTSNMMDASFVNTELEI